ncbi:MAG: hypothetical protein WAM11_17340 [Cyanobium sp.]
MKAPRLACVAAGPAAVETPLDPAALPSPASAERWSWLQRLRDGDQELEPWIAAIEAGRLAPEPDLLEVLADQLDADAVVRLLNWWRAQLQGGLPWTPGELALPQRIGRLRDDAVAAALRRCLAAQLDPAGRAVLLPLLGHQRCGLDFPLLRRCALEPAPVVVRRAALEGLCLGLSAWPLDELRQTMMELAGDLDPGLAAAAVDALARLPEGRTSLWKLRSRALDDGVAARLDRRLRGLQACPLLLLVHGRTQGLIPEDLQALAADLQQRRGAPVLLRALSESRPLLLPPLRQPLWLVPLLLLPGEHVRHDLPRLRRELRSRTGLRMLPFLGAWPAWQRALAAELAALADPLASGERPAAGPPLLLHHPLEGSLALRYLAHLQRSVGCRCQATPYSSQDSEQLALAIDGPVLPLALAANRLTERLEPLLGRRRARPLLERPRLRQLLIEHLAALP